MPKRKSKKESNWEIHFNAQRTFSLPMKAKLVKRHFKENPSLLKLVN